MEPQTQPIENPGGYDEWVDPESAVEKIKLIKNTKGYNWEIKLVGKPEDQLERLKELNNHLIQNYG